jgi:hypothetical protein
VRNKGRSQSAGSYARLSCTTAGVFAGSFRLVGILERSVKGCAIAEACTRMSLNRSVVSGHLHSLITSTVSHLPRDCVFQGTANEAGEREESKRDGIAARAPGSDDIMLNNLTISRRRSVSEADLHNGV